MKTKQITSALRANELYGPDSKKRLRWSCKTCTKRNDHPVRMPPDPTEVFVCSHCKRATGVGFSLERAP